MGFLFQIPFLYPLTISVNVHTFRWREVIDTTSPVKFRDPISSDQAHYIFFAQPLPFRTPLCFSASLYHLKTYLRQDAARQGWDEGNPAAGGRHDRDEESVDIL